MDMLIPILISLMILTVISLIFYLSLDKGFKPITINKYESFLNEYPYDSDYSYSINIERSNNIVNIKDKFYYYYSKSKIRDSDYLYWSLKSKNSKLYKTHFYFLEKYSNNLYIPLTNSEYETLRYFIAMGRDFEYIERINTNYNYKNGYIQYDLKMSPIIKLEY